MYKYYNSNSLGLYVDDCVIRAISTATDRTWDDVYIELCNQARLHGTILTDREFVVHYLDTFYPRVRELPYLVGNVAYEYSNHVLIISMKGHITCSKYGVIYDTFDCRDRTSEFAWIIK